jgi:DHA1 family bicyclomycin/chloramphenicol resistance-like MFS transporter
MTHTDSDATKPAPPRRIMPILLLVIPLSQIPMDIYTPALPQMVLDLHSTSTAMQNMVTAYMLGMSLAFIPIGVLSDTWGRKRVLLSSLAVVVVTSLLCAAATNVGLLLGLRFIQGAAGCACMVLAPAVGGVMVQYVSWRSVFVTIAVLAAVAGAVVAMALPETVAVENRSPSAPAAMARFARDALRNRVFVSFVVVFGLLAAAQLAGELACGALAVRLSTRVLAFSALALFMAGAVVLTVSAMVVGVLPDRSQAPLGWMYVVCGLIACALLGWATSRRRQFVPQT